MTAFSQGTSQDRATLAIHDLCVVFASPVGPVTALDHVSLEVAPGMCLAVVGASGSGKSTLAQACLGLLPWGARVSGRVLFEGRDLLQQPERTLRAIRGRHLGYVGQDYYAAFDPLFPIGKQMIEALRAHAAGNRSSHRVESALGHVGLRPDVLDKYPHEMSGGMLQRAQIAAALLHGPALLVADEPTSALDPVRRAEVATLLQRAREDTGAALLLTTHDLALAHRLADRVAVLHHGRVVETGEAATVLTAPGEPVTERLVEVARRLSLVARPGDPP